MSGNYRSSVTPMVQDCCIYNKELLICGQNQAVEASVYYTKPVIGVLKQTQFTFPRMGKPMYGLYNDPNNINSNPRYPTPACKCNYSSQLKSNRRQRRAAPKIDYTSRKCPEKCDGIIRETQSDVNATWNIKITKDCCCNTRSNDVGTTTQTSETRMITAEKLEHLLPMSDRFNVDDIDDWTIDRESKKEGQKSKEDVKKQLTIERARKKYCATSHKTDSKSTKKKSVYTTLSRSQVYDATPHPEAHSLLEALPKDDATEEKPLEPPAKRRPSWMAQSPNGKNRKEKNEKCKRYCHRGKKSNLQSPSMENPQLNSSENYDLNDSGTTNEISSNTSVKYYGPKRKKSSKLSFKDGSDTASRKPSHTSSNRHEPKNKSSTVSTKNSSDTGKKMPHKSSARYYGPKRSKRKSSKIFAKDDFVECDCPITEKVQSKEAKKKRCTIM